MTARRLIPLVLALALAAPAATAAQDPDQERERAKVEAARQQALEAQHRLQEAIQQLQRSRSQEASLEMQRAMDALRRAQRELQVGVGVYGDLLRDFSIQIGENAVVLAGVGRPRMGAVLGDDTFRADSSGKHVGVRITGVTPGGPAEAAGIRAGDVIVSANGVALERANRREASPNTRLVEIIGGLDEGDTLRVVYRRDGQRGEAGVVVRPVEATAYTWAGPLRELERPDIRVEVEPFLEAARVGQVWMPYNWLSMELVELDPQAGQAQFGTAEGLLVVRPPRDSLLDLRAYDVILNINGRVPTSPSHAIRIMRSYDAGEAMSIEIMRNKRRQTVTATVPDPREMLRMRLREPM